MIIYKTTNNVNGKIYIGKDSKNNPEYYGSGLLISRAIIKYGKENFTKEIIEICTESNINDREIYWIEQYQSFNKNIGYNIAMGGDGGYLCINCPEKLQGENYYLNKMNEDDREYHLNTFRRGLNYWKSKGFSSIEEIENWILKNWSGDNHSHKKHKTQLEYEQWLDDTKRGQRFFGKHVTKNMTDDEYKEKFYKGKNNPIFRNKSEDEMEQWLNDNRRGKNASNAKFIFTFITTDGSILITTCLKEFAKEHNLNVHCLLKIITSTSTNLEYKSRNPIYKNWKGYRKLNNERIKK